MSPYPRAFDQLFCPAGGAFASLFKKNPNSRGNTKKKMTHSNTNPAVCSALRMRTAISPRQWQPWTAHQHGIAVGPLHDPPFTAEADLHPFKRQLHTTHVVAVGWGQHGRPPTACVWGGGSAFLPIGVSVNLK